MQLQLTFYRYPAELIPLPMLKMSLHEDEIFSACEKPIYCILLINSAPVNKND